jgi:hypothetical protein
MDPSKRATTQQLLQMALMQRAQAVQEQLLDPEQRDKVVGDFIDGCTDVPKQLAYRASWEQLQQHLTKPRQQPQQERPAQQQPAEQPQQEQPAEQPAQQQQPQPAVLLPLTVPMVLFEHLF